MCLYLSHVQYRRLENMCNDVTYHFYMNKREFLSPITTLGTHFFILHLRTAYDNHKFSFSLDVVHLYPLLPGF